MSCPVCGPSVTHLPYACEHDDAPRREYRVTDHEGCEWHCTYCDDCANLAKIDWNGETRSCELVHA